MPVSCSAYGCTNRHKKNSGINFHKFPFSREPVLKLWIHAVRRKNFQPTNASRICSAHFRDTDYIKDELTVLKRLKDDAVPSIFPEFRENLQPERKEDRKTRKRNVSESVISFESNSVLQSGSSCIAVTEEASSVIICPDTEVASLVSKSVDTSTQTDGKKIVCVSVQTDERAIPHTVNQVRNENRVLEQRLKRQSSRINNMKNLLNILHHNELVSEDSEEFLDTPFQVSDLNSTFA